MKMIERVARAMWDAREATLPERTRVPFEKRMGDEIFLLAAAAMQAMREPAEEMWLAGRAPIMAFEDKSYGPKWNLGNHMDAGGYKGWATDEERKLTNITKGDCAVFVWRSMIDVALAPLTNPHEAKP